MKIWLGRKSKMILLAMILVNVFIVFNCNISIANENLENEEENVKWNVYDYEYENGTKENYNPGKVAITGFSESGIKKIENGITEIVLPEKNINGENINTISKNAFKGKKITGTLTIPKYVKTIEKDAFKINKIEKLNLNENIEYIYQFSFYNNKISGKLEIPDSVFKISESAFKANNIEELIFLGDEIILDLDAFSLNKIKGELIIPKGTKTIAGGCFSYNEIESLVIGENLKYIENFAFCSNKITKIKFNDCLEKINRSAFHDNNLTGLYFIPETLNHIGENAFGKYNKDEEKIILITPNGKNPNNLKDSENFLINPNIEGSVNIKYINEFNDDIDNKVIKGRVGESFEIYPEEIEGYTSHLDNKEIKGIYDLNPIEIVYKYIKKEEKLEYSNIYVKYQDNKGNDLAEEIVLTGKIGEKYFTENKLIKDYKLSNIIGETSGEFAKNDQNIIYIYSKNKKSEEIENKKIKGNEIEREEIKDNEIEDNIVNKKINRVSGQNRYETAVELSKNIYKTANTVIIANGNSPSDILSSSVLSKTLKAPVLLVSNGNIPSITIKEIKRLNTKEVVIIGGDKSISKNIENELKKYNITRIFGKDRYETSEMIAKIIIKNNPNINKFVLSRGDIYSDALSITSLAVKDINPILLIDENSISESMKKFIKKYENIDILIVGGPNSISKKIEDELKITKKVNRIFGNNRYSTALKIANIAYPNGKKNIIVNGESTIDAIMAGTVTEIYKSPIILIGQSTITYELDSYFKNKDIDEFIIVGGRKNVTREVEKYLENLK